MAANKDTIGRGGLLAGAVIALATAAAYRHTLSVPFVFDDPLSIAGNPTLRHLWPPWAALSPPHGQGLTVEGRPILNLSLAINYAISGTRVWSYHVVNLLIHILAGWTLFGIMRRTWERWGGLSPTRSFDANREGSAGGDACATLLALATALIWTLHPLQTESVTYIVQRAESLMGLFYLLTIYFFIRSIDAAPCWGWLSVAACLLGMGTKEVMVSAPLMVLLYDRTFVTGSFRAAWRARRRYYLALAGTWLLLLCLAGGAGNRGRTAGFGLGVTPWEYALTEFQAIVHYLRLSVWPHPLIFDYGAQWVSRPLEVLPDALVVAGLVIAGAIALLAPTKSGFGRRALGFASAWFFLILAPSSSIVPCIRQTLAEHRMYLPLAAVIAVAVSGIYFSIGSALGLAGLRKSQNRVSAAVLAFLAAACFLLTVRRNEDYRSKVALYRDTAVKRPNNVLARYNFGMALAESGRNEEAIGEFGEAIRLEPEFPQAYFNRGNALAALGKVGAAEADYEAALRINPNYAEGHYALGLLLLRLGRTSEARWHFNAAVLLKPDDLAAQASLKAIDR